MTQNRFYAHSREDLPPEEWQTLEDHLEGVAALARGFAKNFSAGEWAWLSGLWHDLGKYQEAFQEHLAGKSQQVDHSVVGALLAMRKGSPEAVGLALGIAGHHGGLADLAGPGESGAPTPLQIRLQNAADLLDPVVMSADPSIVKRDLPELPRRFADQTVNKRTRFRSYELWTRFLFSCLVDADFLDTEAFLQGDRREKLRGDARVRELRQKVTEHIDKLTRGAPSTEVNRLRAQVLEACRSAAQWAPGFFSLTVPTGGGKTLSSLEFGLRHAELHGLDRVIVAIPYTSIIDQNVKVYKAALGADNVVEHHSSLDPAKETVSNRLASENWDGRVVVTTNVQLFESLFANTPSRCRKLHNVARSVIVLDEVQTVPTAFLSSILEVLCELKDHFGCSVVLSTATQPALQRRESLPHGLAGVREIVPDPPSLFQKLKRVHVEWHRAKSESIDWRDLAEEVTEHEKVLVVVHRRKDARELAQLLPPEGLFHLSALMCGAHRQQVIEEIRRQLGQPGPCRVVSTQLIEAGVDVDFPVVYRAMAALDSITQAAGRCNREGGPEIGRVVVFRAPTSPPSGTPWKGLEATEAMLEEFGGELDISDPGLHEDFFRRLYFREDLDRKGVQALRSDLKLAQVARRVKLVEDGFSRPVLVPYGQGPSRFEELRKEGPSRGRLRALQPYLVNVYEQDFKRLDEAAGLQGAPENGPLVYTLGAPYLHLYDETYGLVLDDAIQPDPAALVISGGI